MEENKTLECQYCHNKFNNLCKLNINGNLSKSALKDLGVVEEYNKILLCTKCYEKIIDKMIDNYKIKIN